MLLKLSDESLMEMLKSYLEPDELFVRPIFGLKQASGALFFLFGVYSAFANKYYAVGFTYKKIILVETGLYSGKVKGGSVIYYNQTKSIKVKNVLGGKKIIIVMEDRSKLIIRAGKNRKIKNQKNNLEEITKMFAK